MPVGAVGVRVFVMWSRGRGAGGRWRPPAPKRALAATMPARGQGAGAAAPKRAQAATNNILRNNINDVRCYIANNIRNNNDVMLRTIYEIIMMLR